MRNKGITLVALVITIIVLLILSGVTISALSGENGIITNAVKAKKMTTLSQCKEEYEMFITEEMIKNNKFQKTSLAAGETNLIYNTQNSGEVGNIYNVIPSLKNNEYAKKLEIIKGDLLLNTKDPKEIELAQSVGIQANPYDIVEGELLSSSGNLLLMDETGTLTIPNNVTKIGEGAFSDLSELKTIIIPGNVKVIGNNAFRKNKLLEKVVMKEGVEEIETNAFRECVNLKEVSMPDSITKLGHASFESCQNLLNMKLSKNIRVIPNLSFGNCIKLNKIDIPEGVLKIEKRAFSNCFNLNNFKISSNINNIEINAFENCKKLENIIVENKNFIYEDRMLMPVSRDKIIFISNNRLLSSEILEFPEGILDLEVNINEYENINTLKIPNTMIKINIDNLPNSINKIEIKNDNINFKVIDNILYSIDEKNLICCFNKNSDIKISEKTEILKESSFLLAPNVSKLILPSNLKKIENSVFSKCKLLDSIFLGQYVSYISPLLNRNFNNNHDIKLIIDSNNPYYFFENNTLYNKDKSELISVLSNDSTEYLVDKNVKKIGDFSFKFQNSFKNIIIPNSVDDIGRAFENCRFTEITLPHNIKTIAPSAFSDNFMLSKIIIEKPKDSIQGAPWGAIKGNRIVEWRP